MTKKYILTLDEGTTSCRSILFDHNGQQVGVNQLEFSQFFPNSGWVEHNPTEILNSQLTTLMGLLRATSVKPEEIAAVGITNQRETIVAWDKRSGQPVHNAIVWQDQRTASYCQELIGKGLASKVRAKTGLTISPYFSGTKLRWILKNSKPAQSALAKGDLLVGTIDTWLIWNLTKGKVHATDVSNASRTLLYNIHNNEWDDELLKLLEIPKSILPTVKGSSDDFGMVEPVFLGPDATTGIPIAGVGGDQQAALFGQLCTNVGDIKSTYGTGCFVLVTTGTKPIESKNNLLTTIAWKLAGQPTVYALEGSVFVAGAALQWVRDNLRLIYNSKESDLVASLATENHGIYFVPSFTGLGAPYWDSYARGAIFGLERGTTRDQIVKATLEAIAYQSNDLIQAMSEDLKKPIELIKVDGGVANSEYTMQFQASISNAKIEKPQNLESTAMGAAFLAGLKVGFWKSVEELQHIRKVEWTYKPRMTEAQRKQLIHGWKVAIKRTMNWTKEIGQE